MNNPAFCLISKLDAMASGTEFKRFDNKVNSVQKMAKECQQQLLNLTVNKTNIP